MSEKLIIMREGLLASLAKDAITFGSLMVLPWFNHAYGGGSGWIYAAIAFSWFVTIVARASGARKRATMSAAEARAWLDANYPVGKDAA
jgi:hypothetical protein